MIYSQNAVNRVCVGLLSVKAKYDFERLKICKMVLYCYKGGHSIINLLCYVLLDYFEFFRNLKLGNTGLGCLLCHVFLFSHIIVLEKFESTRSTLHSISVAFEENNI